ncbi:MarR family transcriptional regulator [Novosphingobium sp. PC22D]|nr:MarR family transcriptional regulator [Novosphingobium sp. PC22D]
MQDAFAVGTGPELDYAATGDTQGGLPVSLSIFADRAHVRETIREDAEAAGVRITNIGDLGGLRGGEARALGDVVLVDCPRVDAACLASLSRLDMRAANSGARIVISTSIAALEDVFACMDQSRPQILVDPDRAERVIALGQIMARFPSARLRELSEEDRLMLLRLTEQVGKIAGRIDRLANPQASVGAGEAGQPSPEASASPFLPADRNGLRSIRPALPDPRLVRMVIKHRRLRARFFDEDLFADPAWDMLLDLTAARAEHARVSVTSLCIAAAVPATTALRWISQMVESGLFERRCDDTDRRRAFIALSDGAAGAMARYFDEIGPDALLAA